MPLSDFLHDLRLIERAAPAQHGALILSAFRRHTPFAAGAVYFRDRDELRLVAKAECNAPDIWSAGALAGVIVSLRAHRDEIGIVALIPDGEIGESDLELVRTAEAFLSTVIANQRLMQETREGDFQLKYRLWELESLYDIGLSIASTLNIDELADQILFRMISLTNARRAALYLREESRFRLYRSFGDLDVAAEMLDRVLAGGNSISGDDGMLVAVPIKGNNAIIGVLAAAERETRDGGLGAFEENDLRLLSLFASQVAIALENARLHREALAKQAMDRELELAATIQRDILPKTIPQVPGLEIATLSRPAKQVGGDYLAFFERDGVLSMLVADVSGKSMPAALLVSALHAVVQLLFAEGRELGEIATELNKHIHRWSSENKFATMIMVSIDRENAALEYVNAGHNPGYVVIGDRIEQLRSHGLPIGILAQTRYVTQTRPFPEGSIAVLYSDGITEAESVEEEEFENRRLEEILRAHPSSSAEELRDRIAAAVDHFTIGAPQKDDQTMIISRSL